MAVYINEIGVRLAVEPSMAPGEDEDPVDAAADVGMTAAQREALVNACTQEVLRTLRTLQER